MKVLENIEAILADDSIDDESCEDSKCERIELLIDHTGWDTIRDAILQVLTEKRRIRDYEVAAEVLWGAVLDGRELPSNRVIGLLYYRFDPLGKSENNLVWSITSKLKGVDYLSDYNPLQDPKIQAELEFLRTKA